MNLSLTLPEIGQRAKRAARSLYAADSELKNRALAQAASSLLAQSEAILAANQLDLAAGREVGLTSALLDRLALTPERLSGIAQGMLDVAALPDPVGALLDETVRPNGLKIVKRAVPIGVIGVIFEARPNVSADSAALCLKSGNASILRGGKEAIRSNQAIVTAIRSGIEEAGLPADCVQLITDTSRQTATEFMHLDAYVDLLIPRGGPGLIQAVKREATVPVIETGAGTCHIYVAPSCDPEMAVSIINNAKTSRPSVCNAVECILVHSACAPDILPLVAAKLKEKNVELRADKRALMLLRDAVPATEEDWGKEYDDYILAIRIVDSTDEAIEYIRTYSTHHSEAILTRDEAEAHHFMESIDSAALYWNASTRFTDGGEFGMGAEIGISTQKLHARGPLGVKQLCSEKYYIYGSGQIR
ncbi:MAG: glutamate-5-semialdehyde dehydrogenase [Firmicutes bacterium]|nr:glutamate-5-semialdehyde dehydrogenase [Bacillota bacterium]